VKPAAALVRQNDTAVTFNDSTREKTNLKELTFLQPVQSTPSLMHATNHYVNSRAGNKKPPELGTVSENPI